VKPAPDEVIRKLTDPLGVAPWMLEPETDDFVRDGFAPRGVDLRDFCIFRAGDLWHIIYTDFRMNQHSRAPGQGVSFGHAVTRDFADWQTLESALFIDPGAWDGRAIWAPYVIEHDGIHHLFYTGLNSNLAQSIGLATSRDLKRFERHPGDPVLVPERFEWCLWSRVGLSNCRDPHVLQLGDRFHLYYTALCKSGEVCVAAAESNDLVDWRDLGPVIRMLPDDLDTSPICLESSFVLPFKDRYVLSYSYDRAIHVNISDDPLHFDPANSVRVLEGHLGLEKVMDLNADGWLVAFFSQIARGRPSKLFFGVLHLAAAEPRVQIVNSRQEMKSYFTA